MTIDEIRKNAPDGATHYRFMGSGRIMYYIFERGELCIMRKNNQLTISAFNIGDYEIKPLH